MVNTNIKRVHLLDNFWKNIIDGFELQIGNNNKRQEWRFNYVSSLQKFQSSNIPHMEQILFKTLVHFQWFNSTQAYILQEELQCENCHIFFLVFFYFLLKHIELIYNVVPVSTVQQSDSYPHIHSLYSFHYHRILTIVPNCSYLGE